MYDVRGYTVQLVPPRFVISLGETEMRAVYTVVAMLVACHDENDTDPPRMLVEFLQCADDVFKEWESHVNDVAKTLIGE